MRSARETTALLLGLSLTGCYPMEQSPLVYASKHQFGVTVAAGTPDSPGLDVNIGYKGLDSAFVPVAVAKRCRAGGDKQCLRSIYEIKVINGQNNVSGSSTSNEQAITKLRADIITAQSDLTNKRNDLQVLNGSIESLKAKQAKEAEKLALEKPGFDSATGAPRALSLEEGKRLAALSAELGELAKLDQKTLQAKAQTLEAEIKGVESRLSQLEPDLERRLGQRNQSSGDAKADALSLYGSFNGKAGGGSDGANLSLGKVFATGVAAQHVAQSIREASALDAKAACLESTAKVLSTVAAGEQTATRLRLLKACGVAD